MLNGEAHYCIDLNQMAFTNEYMVRALRRIRLNCYSEMVDDVMHTGTRELRYPLRDCSIFFRRWNSSIPSSHRVFFDIVKTYTPHAVDTPAPIHM